MARAFSARSANGNAADVMLAEAANDFSGRVDLQARNAELVDRNSLVMGILNLACDLRLTSHGALNLGQGTVGGRLLAASNGGDVTQAGALVVNGGTDIAAGTGRIGLSDTGNRFSGQVQLVAAGGVAVMGATSDGMAAAANAATQVLTTAGSSQGGETGAGIAAGAAGVAGAAMGQVADLAKTQPLTISTGAPPETGEGIGLVRFELNDAAGLGVDYEVELIDSTLRIKSLSGNATGYVSRESVVEAALQALETQLALPRSRVTVAYLAL
jgi:hypothetical protein